MNSTRSTNIKKDSTNTQISQIQSIIKQYTNFTNSVNHKFAPETANMDVNLG